MEVISSIYIINNIKFKAMKKIFAMIALMLPMAVMAQEEKDASLAIPQAETTLRMAADLSKYGYANKDALSLIQAARISKKAGFVREDKEKAESTGTRAASESAQKSGQVSIDPAKLLADAKGMAGDDGVLLALIDDVNSNVRGAVGGSKYAASSVNAGSADVYNVSFRAGELAMVIVIGDGDTDLDSILTLGLHDGLRHIERGIAQTIAEGIGHLAVEGVEEAITYVDVLLVVGIGMSGDRHLVTHHQLKRIVVEAAWEVLRGGMVSGSNGPRHGEFG